MAYGGGGPLFGREDPDGPAAIRENFSRILGTPGSNERPFGVDDGGAVRSPHVSFAPAPQNFVRRGEADAPPTPPMSAALAPGAAPPGYGYYTQDLEVAAAKFGHKGTLAGLDFIDIFPAFFTFCCLLVFLPPIWITVHLGDDESVRHWLGPMCQYAILLPFLFVIGHAVHRRTGLPNKAMVMACLLVPSISLLALNDAVSTMATDKGTQLFSTDCDVTEDKRQLERSWLAAYRLYHKCLASTVPLRENLTMDIAQDLFRIQDCQEYTTAHRSYSSDWDYLRSLEERHHCGGWCTPQRSLWSMNEVIDSCSVAVSAVFRTKVSRFSQHVVLYSFVVLILAAVLLVMAGPALAARGLDW